MRREPVDALIEATREATHRLLRVHGRRLFKQSAIHYLNVNPAHTAAS
jgi:hypothetical protein